jgi:AraC-like DNA-binding protein
MKYDTFHVHALHGGTVTAVDACSTRFFARHAHDEFGVGLMTRGAQRSWSGRGLVEAVSGNIITVNPAELHDGVPIGPARSWSMLYFSKRIVSAVVADLEDGRRSMRELQAPVVDDPSLARIFVATRETALRGEQSGAFEEWLLALFGRLFAIEAKPVTSTSSRLAQVREQIDAAPAHPHTLAELATLAGLSRYQTLRAFARLTGLTPHAYMIQRRLDLARRLIRHGSTLADAAAEAGFADQSHMHRIFIARHGFTPGAFAEAHRRHRAISFKRAPIGPR